MLLTRHVSPLLSGRLRGKHGAWIEKHASSPLDSTDCCYQRFRIKAHDGGDDGDEAGGGKGGGGGSGKMEKEHVCLVFMTKYRPMACGPHRR